MEKMMMFLLRTTMMKMKWCHFLKRKREKEILRTLTKYRATTTMMSLRHRLMMATKTAAGHLQVGWVVYTMVDNFVITSQSVISFKWVVLCSATENTMHHSFCRLGWRWRARRRWRRWAEEKVLWLRCGLLIAIYAQSINTQQYILLCMYMIDFEDPMEEGEDGSAPPSDDEDGGPNGKLRYFHEE